MKPPEGIQAYTVQMLLPSEDRISRNLMKVKPEKYQNVGSCQLLRQVKVCRLFPLRRTVCAEPSTLPPSCPRRRGGGAGTAAPGDSKEGAAAVAPTAANPGRRGHQKKQPESTQSPIIQNPKRLLYVLGTSYKRLILYSWAVRAPRKARCVHRTS